MKYVSVRLGSGDVCAVVFPHGILHTEVRVRRGQLHGAGFVGFDEDGIPYPTGRSDSLNLDPKPEDAAALRQLLRRDP